MYIRTFKISIASLIALLSATAMAAGAKNPSPAPSSDQLPFLSCGANGCSESSLSDLAGNAGTTAADPVPVAFAHPPGQRYIWRGVVRDSLANCANIRLMSPQPDLDNPFDWPMVKEIPVPLGSTDVSLQASFESVLAIQDAVKYDQSGGNAGLLQIRRSSGDPWQDVDLAYGYVVSATHEAPPIMYGTGHYRGIVSLAGLPVGPSHHADAGTVPNIIDVRLGVYPRYTQVPGTSSYTVKMNQVCKGRIEVTF